MLLKVIFLVTDFFITSASYDVYSSDRFRDDDRLYDDGASYDHRLVRSPKMYLLVRDSIF